MSTSVRSVVMLPLAVTPWMLPGAVAVTPWMLPARAVGESAMANANAQRTD